MLKDDRDVTVDGRKQAIEDISGDPGTNVYLVVERRDEQLELDVPRVDYRLIAM